MDDRLSAWLTFLASDDPEDIIALIERYPDFKAMYEQVYQICRNVDLKLAEIKQQLQQALQEINSLKEPLE